MLILKKFCFSVATIIDVGVSSSGTPHLYQCFPEAQVIFIDPLDIVAETVERFRNQNYKIEWLQCAVGRDFGEGVLKTPGDAYAQSSLNKRTNLTAVSEEDRRTSVQITPLDELIVDKFKGPFGLKIDTEGHEIEVLLGAKNTLKNCEFVIAETSIKNRFEHSYKFSELVSLMAESGFELLDILNKQMFSPRYMDCLFVPVDSPHFSLDGNDYAKLAVERNSTAGSSVSVSDLVTTAESALANEDHEEAARLASDALKRRPDVSVIHSLMGLIEETQGNFDQARVHYSDASNIDESNVDALRGLRRIFEKCGDWSSAIEVVRKEISCDQDSSAAYFALGNLYLKIKGAENAELAFRNAIAIDPDHPDYRCKLALVFSQSGRDKEAELEYRTVLTLYPEHAGAMRALAEVLARNNNLDEALSYAREAAKRRQGLPYFENFYARLVAIKK